MSEWQPIETAPKDGTTILIDCVNLTDGMTLVFWDNGRLVSAWDGNPPASYITPAKYWRHLPSLPEYGQ